MPFMSEEEDGKIKPANYNQEYTKDQLIEYIKCTKDPIHFITKYVKIQHPKLGAVNFNLFDYQRKLIEVYNSHNKVVGMMSRQSGKALALDTPIATPSGWSTMGDLRVGDQVYAEDGSVTQITFATDPMYDHKCYKVTFDTGESIVADAEHLWKYLSPAKRRGKQTIGTTEELLRLLQVAKRNSQGVRIKSTGAIEGFQTQLPIDPYILGVWLGDGNRRDARITSHAEDYAAYKNLFEVLGYTVSDFRPDPRSENTGNWKVDGLHCLLRESNLLHNKHIPATYLRSSYEIRLSLLQGLMDTDGSIDKKGSAEFYQKNLVLVEQVRELLFSLGIKNRVREKIINGQIYYTVAFSTTDHVIVRLPRKRALQEKCVGHRKNGHHYIESIEEVESVPVRCIRIDHPSHMFLCGRSMIPTHNTATASAFLLWWAIFKKNQDILILSKDHDGAKEVMERIWYAYEELPWWIKPGVKRNQVHTKKFDNGSKIKALATTASAGRGKSISLLYLDEFAYVRPGIAEDFWTSIYPVLSTGGRCIVTSTPNSDEDKFAKIWMNATMSPLSDKWEDVISKKVAFADDPVETYDTLFENQLVEEEYKIKEGLKESEDDSQSLAFIGFHAHWTSVPQNYSINSDGTVKVKSFRGEAFKISTLKAGFTQEQFDREYNCSFLSGDATLISPMRLATLKHHVREPKFVDRWGTRWYEEIYPNTAYAVTLDPSEGVGLDDACIQVWEIPSLRQVAEWNSNKVDQVEQTRMLRRVLKRIYKMQRYHPSHDGSQSLIYFSVERNGQGVGIINAIMYEGEDTFPGYFIHGSTTSIHAKGASIMKDRIHKWNGLWTSPASKKRYALEFKSLVERGLFLPRSARLVSQLKTFVRTGSYGYTAKEGAKDDIVMSCVLMAHMIDELRYQEPDLDDLIRPDLVEDPNDGSSGAPPLPSAAFS